MEAVFISCQHQKAFAKLAAVEVAGFMEALSSVAFKEVL